MGNFVLTNGILDRYYFGSDGYAKFTNGKPVYSSRIKGYTYSTVKSSDVLLNPDYRVTQNVYPFYFVKDHLGSNRMVADNPSTMVSYYPYGGIYYDDFRFYQADDNHLYNGKEMDRMYGLDTYDHGARQYNPARITWDRMDQLSEDKPWQSPYLFCSGNPVNRIDPDGKDDFFDNSGKFIRSTTTRTNNIYVIDGTTKTLLSNYKFNSNRSMMRVVFHYAQKIGGFDSNVTVGVDSRTNFNGENIQQLFAYSTQDNKHIRMVTNNGHFNENMNNISNMKSTIKHEQVHTQLTESYNLEEIRVLIEQINDPSFKNVTEKYQNMICKNLQDALVELYDDNPTQFDEWMQLAQPILNRYNFQSTPTYINGGREIIFK